MTFRLLVLIALFACGDNVIPPCADATVIIDAGADSSSDAETQPDAGCPAYETQSACCRGAPCVTPEPPLCVVLSCVDRDCEPFPLEVCGT